MKLGTALGMALGASLAPFAATAAAQAPALSKAGVEAITIDLVGRSAPTARPDTTSMLAGREEAARFVARARAARARGGAACGAGDAAPTLGGAGNGWTLRLTCVRPAAAEWRLVYTAAASAGTPGAVRTATLGDTAALDAWLARLDALTRGPRPIRLKPLPRSPSR